MLVAPDVGRQVATCSCPVSCTWVVHNLCIHVVTERKAHTSDLHACGQPGLLQRSHLLTSEKNCRFTVRAQYCSGAATNAPQYDVPAALSSRSAEVCDMLM